MPFVPSIAERLDPDVVQLHSTVYRRPQDIPEGPVLVVGGGNTGLHVKDDAQHLAQKITTFQPPAPVRTRTPEHVA